MTDPIMASLKANKVNSPRVNNNIAPIKTVKHLRLVRFDFDSPRMAESMVNLGLVKEDLNTQKTKEDFHSDDPKITNLHFQYY